MSAPAINKLEDSATGRALQAAVQGSAVLDTFVDFTSDLIRNVFTTLVDTSMDQLEAYADLVAKVSGTVADFEARTIGDVTVAGDKFIDEVLLPQFMLGYAAGDTIATVSDPVPLDATKVADFKVIFTGVTVSNQGIEGVITATPDITVANLKAFAQAKLKRDVQKSYDLLVTLLKLGMQKIVVTDGEIHTKLTFHVDAKDTDESSSSSTVNDTLNTSFNWGVSASRTATRSLAWKFISRSVASSISGSAGGARSQSVVKVNVANEKHTAQTSIGIDILGEVMVRFRSDFFPSFDPATVGG